MSLDPKAISSLFELSRDAVMGVENNQIFFANPAARRMLGISPGCSAEEILPGYLLDEDMDHYVASAHINGRTTDITVSRVESILLLCCPIPAEGSAAPDGTARVFSDALASLRLAVDGLVSASGAESDTRMQAYSSVLYQNYYRLLRLCGHLTLLENMKKGIQPANFRTVDLESLCAELCQSTERLAATLDIRVEFHCTKGLFITAADPDLLEVLLLNLMTNSLQNCAAGATVRLGLKKQGDRFVLSVDDDGKGIDADSLRRQYDRQQERELNDYLSGAGLGLPLVKGIIELHGGAILQQSRSGGSSTRVFLPCRTPEGSQLQQSLPRYGGMQRILSELSVVLPSHLYKRNLMD